MRGPARSPSSMASRALTPRSGLAEAASKIEVKPCSSSRRRFLAVSSMWRSGPIRPRSGGAMIPVKLGWQWPSTMPGIRVIPAPSIRSSGRSPTGSPAGATAAMRLPSTTTVAGTGPAASPSHTCASVTAILDIASSLLCLPVVRTTGSRKSARRAARPQLSGRRPRSPQNSGWPRAASSSASACASVSTLIVAMPMARAGFRLMPRSSRKTQACGSTPSRSQARR